MSSPTIKPRVSAKKPTSLPRPPHHERPDGGEAFLHDPTASRPQMHSNDPLAEMFGEQCVMSATSGEDSYPEDLDVITIEELGGPFVPSSSEEEIGRDEPEVADTTREPFPLPQQLPNTTAPDR